MVAIIIPVIPVVIAILILIWTSDLIEFQDDFLLIQWSTID